jgi:hypothetical protein
LQWGQSVRVATLEVVASAAPSVGREGRVPLEARLVTLAVSATRVTAPQGAIATMRASVTGTLAKHAATFGATGGDFDLTAAFTGGLAETKLPNGTAGPAWSGTLDSLANRGTYALQLESPTALEVAPDRIHVGATRVAVAEGRAELASFAIDDGRIATRGSFTGIPVAALARLSGTTLPFPSTLAVGGDWSLAATPRLSGAVNVRREAATGSRPRVPRSIRPTLRWGSRYSNCRPASSTMHSRHPLAFAPREQVAPMRRRRSPPEA